MTNGVYILKCKDQYRVRAFNMEVENLTDVQLVEKYSECKFTRSKTMALHIASRLYNSIGENVCVRGIQFITVNMTWAKLVAASQPTTQEEVVPVNEIISDTMEVVDEVIPMSQVASAAMEVADESAV